MTEAGPFHAFTLGKMSVVRMFQSIPALVLALSSLAGCYDLSAPSGPHREDFLGDPGAAEAPTDTQQQGEQAQPIRADQAAVAATRALVTSDTASKGASEPNDRGVRLTPTAGTDITIGDYVARYLQPAPSRD